MPLTFDHFSAWIEVDGSEVPVFDAQENNNEVTGWIPSETGKKFCLKLSTGTRGSSMAADIYMDGKPFSGKAIYAGPPRMFTISGVATSNTTEKPFMFSPLELTDDDDYLHTTTTGLGDVKLVISYATFGGEVNQYHKYDPVGKVHEKSKKATGHKIDLGQETSKAHSSTVVTTRHAVITTFVFKYRPIDMLRANGIAPPAPVEESKKRAASPTNGPDVLDLTGDSDDENERRIQTLRDELAGLERKRRKTSRIKPEPGVKQEESSSSAGRSRTVSLGIVDLT
ncbi:hypothetical protein BT96DRAFT_1024525 [Gymnopus androsaceus JB14]|uniref:DUF7918 domain-containing protein n=1 Tax=Gymnopus androsaceus JB14 TaxID=1447944 RepID=A0A6A4GYF0_9AGAR|nr:hypothetical protein BT96DRAFT_1024525 [Gymnopus androsaceus JB14]